MEGEPKEEKTPINMEQMSDGTNVMVAEKMINEIEEYEEMDVQKKVEAITSKMDELAIDNDNRFLVEELARRAHLIQLYEKQSKIENEIVRAGGIIDDKV